MPFSVVCGTSHNSSRLESYGHVKLEDPHESSRSYEDMKHNVLLVEYMKHNNLSVSQMCDERHKVIFDSQKGEIRKEGLGKLIATTARTSSNIYVLSEIGNEKCCLGKEDESWL
jgi:hypothetical protein